MVVVLGDGKGPPISLPSRYLAVYTDDGNLIYAAEQLGDDKIRQAIVGDNDLPDIVAANGLPFKNCQDVTDRFNLQNGIKVFKTE